MSTVSRDAYFPAAPPEPPTSLWRSLDFLLLWWGQFASVMGSQMSMLAFPLLVLAITGSPAEAGLLGALRSLPFIALTLPAGALVDRWDRKRVMILADTGRALAFGSIPLAAFLGHLTLLQLAIASMVEGTLFTFFNVAESAALPQVVTRDQVPNAVGVSAVTDQVSGLVGPSLGGLLYAVGRTVPFLVDAVSYLLSVVTLFCIRTEFQQERTEAAAPLREEISTGLNWLWHNPLMRFLALLIGGLNLFCFGYPLLIVVRAQELHADSVAIGLVFAAGSVGGLLGALVTPWLQRHLRFGVLMSASIWLWALTWIPFALAPSLLWFGLANALAWWVVPVTMSTQYSYRLMAIPDAMRGRVNSVFKLIAFGVEPLALALTGVLLQRFTPTTTILILFVPQILLALAAQCHAPLRHAPTLAAMSID